MDRKERIRQYKSEYRPMGVYRVRNARSGVSFLGSSGDVPAMLNRHRFQLESGLHPNKELQADWDRLGPDAFEFETVDALEPPEEPGYDPADDLRMLEDLWREKLAAAGETLYNAETRRDA